MKFQRETWKQCGGEIALLAPEHWRELAIDQERVILDLDTARYQQFEDAGILLLVTARDGDELAGYWLAFLGPHPHYRTSGLMAVTDAYYVRPKYRTGYGAKLFRAAEREMKALNVTKAYLSCKLHQDHSALFEALGWKATDIMFTKVLG